MDEATEPGENYEMVSWIPLGIPFEIKSRKSKTPESQKWIHQ